MDVHEELRQTTIQRDSYMRALRGLPVILRTLDADGRDMLADLLQGTIEVGYQNGVDDCTDRKGEDEG